MATKKLPKTVKYALRTLPLAGAVASSFLPLQQIGRQFLILIVLVWVQVYFVLELFMAGR
jgi:hypothetical protein